MSYRVINGDSDVKTNITVFKTLLCFIEQVGLETQVEDFYDGNRWVLHLFSLKKKNWKALLSSSYFYQNPNE